MHVGFAHSGTTSLQENIFSKRTDLFYAGVPYGDLGGIFSWVKYREPRRYDSAATTALAAELIFGRMHAGQRLVISDETLLDQPAIYYTPAMMHVALIAERIRRSLPAPRSSCMAAASSIMSSIPPPTLGTSRVLWRRARA
jgi:hypothetical protein